MNTLIVADLLARLDKCKARQINNSRHHFRTRAKDSYLCGVVLKQTITRGKV